MSQSIANQGSSPPAEPEPGALGRFARNLLSTPRTFRESLVRHGRPTSDRAASQAVFGNVFLHILPVRIHRDSLRFKTTLGLGVISTVLFALLVVTGAALMIYYKPSVADAYDSMKDIEFIVPAGRFMRNIHRWAAHAMVACVLLHMARVFYTGAYKKPREFNWVVGMLLFVLTLGLSFTGYLLPWDQLAFWAVTIGASIAESPRELTDALGITSWLDIGGMQKQLLLGANHVGQEALIRFYLLHVIVLPLVLTALVAVHFWRIRKDGGLARGLEGGASDEGQGTTDGASGAAEGGGAPAAGEPAPADQDAAAPASHSPAQDSGLSTLDSSKTYGLMAVVPGRTPAVDRALAETVPSWPNALYAIGALSMLTLAVMLALGFFIDAPLKELANPAVPENPAKAPWYFLGLQEMVSYSAFMGGIGIPGIIVLGLMLVPYLDRERRGIGVWFGGPGGRSVCLASAVFMATLVVLLLWFTVTRGWLRNWYPEIPQLVITFVNPGTVIVAACALWSLGVVRCTNSTRAGASALFTCFLVGFVILTYFATVHRGPNWEFYWSQSQWPVH